MTTTNSGVAISETLPLDAEDGTAAFLAALDKADAELDPKKRQPSEETSKTTKTEEEQPEAETEEEVSDESPDTEAEETEEEETTPEKKYVENDDVFVKVKVDGEEREFTVKELTRLAGQEAALTRKSQEAAQVRQKVDAEAQRYAAGLDVMMKLAEARANEFRQVNFLALTKDPNVNAEQLSILQSEARKAFEQEAFLKQELGTFVQAQQQQAQVNLVEQAKACVQALNDKDGPNYIEGWNQKTYDTLRSFAVEEGLDQNTVNQLVDPAAIKLLHMAMAYKKGSSKVTTQKINKSPKKIVKNSSAPAAQSLKPSREKEAMKKLKSNGNLDNAADAFLARLENQSD
jgi:hypothetical protein